MLRLSRIKKLVFIALLAGGFAPACGADEAIEEEVVLETGNLDVEGGDKADRLSTTSTFFSVRPDARRCAYPTCGGWWVKRLNSATTRCADGRPAAECYVAEHDLSGTGLANEQIDILSRALTSGRAVVRGSIGSLPINGRTWGVLKGSEGWLGTIEAVASGTFFRITDSGIRCLRAPCPSMHAAKLNSTWSTNITDLTGASITEKVPNEIGNDSGVLAAGTLYRRGQALTLRATQAFLLMVPVPESNRPCSELSVDACASNLRCEVGPTGCDRPACEPDGEGGRVCHPCDPILACRDRSCTTSDDCGGGTTCQPAFVCITFPCDAPMVCR
jgi:hypothetical protein